MLASVIGTFFTRVGRGQNAIINATGVASRLFRAPYGAVSPSVIATAEKNKLLSVLWEGDTNDWQRPGADAIVTQVLDQVHAATPQNSGTPRLSRPSFSKYAGEHVSQSGEIRRNIR